MAVFIGGAWPYANGSLHLGHIASLLPGDLLARYYRQKGEPVLYVSGSDCNGTPIAIRAKQEGVTPGEIADRYHKEFHETFEKLGFTFDCYTRTDTPHHHKVVQNLFLQLLQNQKLYIKAINQAYCYKCNQFLPDRYVEGNCPHCGAKSRGDQCDECSAILDPLELLNKTCKLCGHEPVARTTEHFYFRLSELQDQLENYLADAKSSIAWRDNAIQLTERYLKEGLHDRAVSRDLENGVSVPVKGFESKKIYVWIEAVAGYYSASQLWASETGLDDTMFWEHGVNSYYVHGKDNIPFHSIIWPSLLMGIKNPSLPKHIVSNEYLTIERRKLSTSKNWAVWVHDLLETYNPDSLRYFLTINAPENRDTDFSWREFIHSHNSELLGAFGNFVNRTLKFIQKSYNGELCLTQPDSDVSIKVEELYQEIGELLEAAHFKEALEKLFEWIRSANKYFDHKEPWKQIHSAPESCQQTLSTCLYIIQNLAQLLNPFLPFSCAKIRDMLGCTDLKWEPIIRTEIQLKEVQPLYERIDISQIEIEVEKLNAQVLS